MQLTEAIEKLNDMLQEHGDIDLVYVMQNYHSSFEVHEVLGFHEILCFHELKGKRKCVAVGTNPSSEIDPPKPRLKVVKGDES